MALGRRLQWVLVFIVCKEVCGVKIQNKLLGSCLQVQDGSAEGRVSLGNCSPYSALQEWSWHAESQAVSNYHTGLCLTAPEEQHEGVYLQACIFKAGNEDAVSGMAAMEMGTGDGLQAWSCSKKGHLTLSGTSLRLSATQESTLVFLSKDHKQGSRWWTLDNQTLCSDRDGKHPQHQDQPRHLVEELLQPAILPPVISEMHSLAQPFEIKTGVNVSPGFTSTKSPADPTMVFLSMDYGMGWKVTMLVLSSLALVLGTVILIFNVYSHRKEKVVCVLNSYMPRQDESVPGSPVPSERAPLTEHAMRLPQSSPFLQRGEILIQWKDGSVTPLYSA
ncbi:uncharacterized protein LOC117510375 [Thalassophryne amazonica]|uniref:uncharacterized protein LOC117510375 n=1 Tax=Thalassophryne amazonica TaxID=390379 RepID=UPI001470D3E3|nr:uncharacterized protein LOC117510375 [Thalassophryne amazonica]